MNEKLEVLGRIALAIIFFTFAIAFFLHEQFILSFLTLVLLLVLSKWDQMKRFVAGRGRVEVEVFKPKDLKNNK